MARIAEILENGPTYSYEFFPPKDDRQSAALAQTIEELSVTDPDFISVTHRAQAGTGDATQEVVVLQNDTRSFPVMAHLTCAGQTGAEVTAIVDGYADDGLENILALRGDSDEHGDFGHAIDLAEFIKGRHPGMSLGVAGHPEVHPDSRSRSEDRRHLAAKLEVADFAITQFFFDADDYRRLVDELDVLDCRKPVIPGIMLFASAAGLRRMAAMNDSSLPSRLTGQLDALDRPEDISKLAVETAAELIDDLGADDVPGLHIYTLNRSQPALELKKLVGQL